MRYVGIDPSTKLGFVALNEDGSVDEATEIQTDIKDDPQRFIQLANKVLGRLKKNDSVAIEGFSYGSKGRGVSIQYGIGWEIRSELVKREFTYQVVPPSSLKKFATGKGNCSKDALVLPIFKRWGFEHDSDNVRDAFVLAKIGQALSENIELTKYQKEALKKVTEEGFESESYS